MTFVLSPGHLNTQVVKTAILAKSMSKNSHLPEKHSSVNDARGKREEALMGAKLAKEEVIKPRDKTYMAKIPKTSGSRSLVRLYPSWTHHQSTVLEGYSLIFDLL